MKQYEPCPRCADDRASGNLDRAQYCSSCKGKGMRRVPSSFVCNKCSGPLCPAGTMNEDIPHGLVEATVSGGYDSYHLFDTTNYEFSVCEKCLREFFGTFAIPPAISFYMGGGGDDYTYAQDEDAYRHRVWRDAGGARAKLKEGLCNVVIECPNKAVWRQFCSENLTETAMCDEHKRGARFANSYEARAEHVPADIPMKCADRTPEQKKIVAWAWLRSAAVPGKITYFQYISGCVGAHVGCIEHAITKEESTGGIWFPAKDVPEWARGLNLFPFDDGTLAVGPYHDVRRLVGEAQAAGKLNIVAAPILPHLHDKESGEDESA